RQLAGRLPAAAREQPDQEEAWPTQGEEPGGHRAADGGASVGAYPVAAGTVLSTDQEPHRRQGSDHGDGSQVGLSGVPDAENRSEEGKAITRRRRDEDTTAARAIPASEGGGPGIRVGIEGSCRSETSFGLGFVGRPRPGGRSKTVTTRQHP